MTDEGKEREARIEATIEAIREALAVPWDTIGAVDISRAYRILREHDARIWEEAAKVVDDEAREHEGRAIAAREDPDYDDGSEIESALGIVLRKCAAALRARAQGKEPGDG